MLKLLAGTHRLSYRRLLAFLVGTALLIGGSIDQECWQMVTLVFIGAEIAEKYIAKPKAQEVPGGE